MLPLFLVLCISAVRGSEAEELPLKYENFASRNYASKYNAAFSKGPRFDWWQYGAGANNSGVNISKQQNGSVTDRSILLFWNPDNTFILFYENTQQVELDLSYATSCKKVYQR